MSSFENHSPYEQSNLDAPVSLEDLSPGSVVALFRHIDHMYGMALKGGPRCDEHFDNLKNAVGRALDGLPGRNLAHARTVFQAFADSPLADDRRTSSFYISCLTREDHDFGLNLWHRLARDVEGDVRDAAVDIEVEPDEEFAGIHPYLGITWHEARWLILEAEGVDSGEALPFDLAAVALRQVVAQVGTAPSDPA